MKENKMSGEKKKNLFWHLILFTWGKQAEKERLQEIKKKQTNG